MNNTVDIVMLLELEIIKQLRLLDLQIVKSFIFAVFFNNLFC